MIDFLRSKVATLCVLVLALIAQIPHAAEVFRQAGNVHDAWATVHSYTYALALELAVLLFVVQGHRHASYAFALVSVLVNLAYYAQRVQLLSMQGASAWLISIALPVAIALYSHAVADAHDSASPWGAVRAWWERWYTQSEVAQSQPVQSNAQPVQLSELDCASECTDAQPEPKDLAAQLRDEGLTYAQIAERLGVHRNTVGGWLRNGASA